MKKHWGLGQCAAVRGLVPTLDGGVQRPLWAAVDPSLPDPKNSLPYFLFRFGTCPGPI